VRCGKWDIFLCALVSLRSLSLLSSVKIYLTVGLLFLRESLLYFLCPQEFSSEC